MRFQVCQLDMLSLIVSLYCFTTSLSFGQSSHNFLAILASQELMPDSLHWLGITKIDNLISMSDMKYNAIVGSGIEVIDCVPICHLLIVLIVSEFENVVVWPLLTGVPAQVLNRVAIPDELIPADAHVEIDAKMYAGYYVPEEKKALVNEDLVKQTKGRGLDEDMLAGPMDGV
jgi:hypothetical protein